MSPKIEEFQTLLTTEVFRQTTEVPAMPTVPFEQSEHVPNEPLDSRSRSCHQLIDLRDWHRYPGFQEAINNERDGLLENETWWYDRICSIDELIKSKKKYHGRLINDHSIIKTRRIPNTAQIKSKDNVSWRPKCWSKQQHRSITSIEGESKWNHGNKLWLVSKGNDPPAFPAYCCSGRLMRGALLVSTFGQACACSRGFACRLLTKFYLQNGFCLFLGRGFCEVASPSFSRLLETLPVGWRWSPAGLCCVVKSASLLETCLKPGPTLSIYEPFYSGHRVFRTLRLKKRWKWRYWISHWLSHAWLRILFVVVRWQLCSNCLSLLCCPGWSWRNTVLGCWVNTGASAAIRRRLRRSAAFCALWTWLSFPSFFNLQHYYMKHCQVPLSLSSFFRSFAIYMIVFIRTGRGLPPAPPTGDGTIDFQTFCIIFTVTERSSFRNFFFCPRS